MKQTMLFLALLITSLPSIAQLKVIKVKGADGTTQCFDWKDIQKIRFDNDNEFLLESANCGPNWYYTGGVENITFDDNANYEELFAIGKWEIVDIILPEGYEVGEDDDLKVGDWLIISSNKRVYDQVDEVALWTSNGLYALTDAYSKPSFFNGFVERIDGSNIRFHFTYMGINMTFVLKRLTNEDYLADDYIEYNMKDDHEDLFADVNPENFNFPDFYFGLNENTETVNLQMANRGWKKNYESGKYESFSSDIYSVTVGYSSDLSND